MSQEYESVELVGDDVVRHFAVAVLIAALTAALAQFSIPLPNPVPDFSLQPFGPFFAALLLGPLWGGLSLSLYVLAGVAGAPVFSNGHAGLGYVLVGDGTGGYILGFVLGAVIGGAIVHRGITPNPLDDVGLPYQVGGLVATLAVIYAVGVPWLTWVTGLPLSRAVALNAPLVPLDIVKLLVAVGIVRGGYLTYRSTR